MKLTSLMLLFFCGLLALNLQAIAADKPHIVHIVADDLGWKDVGFNGCSDINTPSLDALAAVCAKLTQFYVQPMCTPTRAALMTGRYPFRYGLQTAVIPSVSTYGLDTTEWLMPECLKEAGYNTAIIGKWHLGHAEKKYWPKQRGFDYQYGAMIGELDYFTHEEHGVLDWYRDNKPVREQGYTTQLIGSDAVKYINAQQSGKPLSEHQLVARHLAELFIAERVATQTCEHASRQWDAASPDMVVAAVLAKHVGATNAASSAATAVQVLASAGSQDGHVVARAFRDAKMMEIIEGSNEISQLILARHAVDVA